MATGGPSSDDALRTQCWDNALYAFGTAYIFEQRAATLRKRLRLLQFVGLVVPLTVGSMVMAFGTSQQYLAIVLIGAGALGVGQVAYSLWALTERWEDSFAYAQESVSANHRLSLEYRNLGETLPPAGAERDLRLAIISEEDRQRSDQDYKQGITEPEKRMGMHAALRNFRRHCAGCNQIPTSMTAGKCDICGNY